MWGKKGEMRREDEEAGEEKEKVKEKPSYDRHKARNLKSKGLVDFIEPSD